MQGPGSCQDVSTIISASRIGANILGKVPPYSGTISQLLLIETFNKRAIAA